MLRGAALAILTDPIRYELYNFQGLDTARPRASARPTHRTSD